MKKIKKISTFFLQLNRPFSTTNYALSSSYRCDYGQGGTLQLSLANKLYDLKLETIWEDFTEVEAWKTHEQNDLFLVSKNEGKKKELFNISDENYKGNQDSLIDSGVYQLKVKLPEYYSYKIMVKGNVEHVKSTVDAKTYGNVDINTMTAVENGNIFLNKLKSESCNLQSKTGKISILSSLEAQNANISTDSGNIFIKKLGITSKAHIFSREGNITINSLYGSPSKKTGHEQPELNEVPTEIHKSNFVSLNAINSDVLIGNAQGNLIVQCLQGNMEIKRCDVSQMMIESESGEIRINLLNLKQSSLIKLNKYSELFLTVNPEFNGNIYFVDSDTFFGEENRVPGTPTLYIKGRTKPGSISYSSKNNIYSFLRN